MLMMFYLNVFNLPTLKDVVGHYKLWNEVIVWFTQMMFYNIYIPSLIRQANDVEENPGPTIYDIIDPTTAVSADSSQGNEALFGENAVKQCVANISLPAIIYNPIPARGGDSHMKQTGMLVVSLRGVNFGFWSRLGCYGQSANILCRQGLV